MVNRSPFIVAALIVGAACVVLLGQELDPAPDTDESEPELIDDRPGPRPGKAAPEDAAARAILDRVLPEVTFDGVGLSDVIDFLRDFTNTNIFVNWRALEAAGIDRNAPVTLRIKDVKFSKALQVILDDVGGDEVRLKYAVEEGVVTISTAAPHAHARAYDVRDILQASAAAAPRLDPAKRLATLRKMITGSVAPDSWQANHVTAKPDEGKLVITQTPANHDAVANLLAQTRALLGLPPAENPAPVVPDSKE